MTDGKLSVTFILMSIMVYPFMNERINRYTVNFGNMFTLPVRSVYKELHADRETGC